MIWEIVTFMTAAGIIITGLLIKKYTRSKLRDIDGVSPIIRQDIESEYMINEF